MAFLKWNPFSWVPHSPLHLFGRPLISVEPFQRDLPTKFRAEARPSERKLIVLWSIDTWRLTIELPDHKSTAWNTSILLLLRQKLVGQLNHVGLIIPKACPFLSRLYLAQELAGRKGAGACLECGYRPTPLAPISPAGPKRYQPQSGHILYPHPPLPISLRALLVTSTLIQAAPGAGKFPRTCASGPASVP